MELRTVIKRDGREVEFSSLKIRDAVDKACHATNEPEMGNFVFHQLEDRLVDRMNVEQIQDMIEEVLMKYNPNVARAYIKYRYNREQLRSIRPIDLIDKYLDESDWRVKENASVGFSLGGMILNNSGAVTANYWLNKIYPKEIGDAHRECKFHIHDLSMLACYCVGHNLLDLIQKGIGGVPGKITSAPAKHLSTLCNHMVNYIGLLQNENAGAQAFSSFDTYLAPYIKYEKLTREQVYQCLQSFMYGINTSSRWGSQAPFSNVTMDWKVPKDLAEVNCWIGDKQVDFKYKDCQPEMDIINDVMIDLYMHGDANGRSFAYPIVTYSITKDFEWDTPLAQKLFEMTCKYGVPYFQNFISSDLHPEDVRSMPLSEDTLITIRVNDEIITGAISNFTDLDNFQVKFLDQWKNARLSEFAPTDVIELNTLSTSNKLGLNHAQPVVRNGQLMTVRAEEIELTDLIPVAINNNIKFERIISLNKEPNTKKLFCVEVILDE